MGVVRGSQRDTQRRQKFGKRRSTLLLLLLRCRSRCTAARGSSSRRVSVMQNPHHDSPGGCWRDRSVQPSCRALPVGSRLCRRRSYVSSPLLASARPHARTSSRRHPQRGRVRAPSSAPFLPGEGGKQHPTPHRSTPAGGGPGKPKGKAGAGPTTCAGDEGHARACVASEREPPRDAFFSCRRCSQTRLYSSTQHSTLFTLLLVLAHPTASHTRTCTQQEQKSFVPRAGAPTPRLILRAQAPPPSYTHLYLRKIIDLDL